MKSTTNDIIYVLSSQVGEVGGAAKATRLLCEAYVRMQKRVRLFVTLPPDAENVARLSKQNIEIVTPRFNKGWRYNLPQKQLAQQIYQSACRERPALIHSVSLSIEARFLLQLPRTAPIYLWETTEALPHVKFVDKEIGKYLHRATGVLAPSEIVSRNVSSTYQYDGPMLRLPFWCEAPTTVVPSYNTRNGHFLYVGRMDMDKGFEYLFQAFQKFQQQHPTARLTICGGGDIEAVNRLAQGIPAIDIRGYVSEDEYEQAIATCVAFVLPSLHEGYPLSLLEVCARGKPIIATRVGSIPEIFENRPCALLVPARDSEALSVAMTRLMEDNEQTYWERCADAQMLFQEISSVQTIECFLLKIMAAQTTL